MQKVHQAPISLRSEHPARFDHRIAGLCLVVDDDETIKVL